MVTGDGQWIVNLLDYLTMKTLNLVIYAVVLFMRIMGVVVRAHK